MRVAVPPMLEAIASMRRRGPAGMPSTSVTEIVTGTTVRRVVTLSRNIEAIAVAAPSDRKRMVRLPRAIFAARIAMYWKNPVSRSSPTMAIIPNRSHNVSMSMLATAAW